VTQVETDVLIIGAGPAGSAAALLLAGTGLRVLLADRCQFPRDKTCGDALIPDALCALGELGLRDHVLGASHVVRSVRVYAPNSEFMSLEGKCACVPRAVLDDILRRAAVEAGASFYAPVKALTPLEANGAVRGATLEDLRTHATLEVRASLTILATGAASDVLQRFGMCLRLKPSATAARCYVRVHPEAAAAHNHLSISYASAICPGYGWIFPGPDHVFNIGIGYVYDGPAPVERNVRTLLGRFLEVFPPAVALMESAASLTPLKGAPLRTAMAGARHARPGLLVVGEAAGLTYSFTGEGIGKALQSGIMAARITEEVGALSDAALRNISEIYTRRLTSRFAQRFRAYARLQDWMAYPWVANLLVRRANAGSFVRSQFEALLNESGRPDGLLSLPGVIRALLM
jgi:geranylgeranyl reductase family protein